jgi:hypothetical protein
LFCFSSFLVLGGGSTNEAVPFQNRRSLKEMENALQTPSHTSTIAKNKLYENVSRAITPTSINHPSTTPSPLTLSSKQVAKKFDLKFICPHGNASKTKIGLNCKSDDSSFSLLFGLVFDYSV